MSEQNNKAKTNLVASLSKAAKQYQKQDDKKLEEEELEELNSDGVNSVTTSNQASDEDEDRKTKQAKKAMNAKASLLIDADKETKEIKTEQKPDTQPAIKVKNLSDQAATPDNVSKLIVALSAFLSDPNKPFVRKGNDYIFNLVSNITLTLSEPLKDDEIEKDEASEFLLVNIPTEENEVEANIDDGILDETLNKALGSLVRSLEALGWDQIEVECPLPIQNKLDEALKERGIKITVQFVDALDTGADEIVQDQPVSEDTQRSELNMSQII